MKRFALTLVILFTLNSFDAKKTTWLALGDSITYLNEHHDETGNRITRGYLTRVADALPDITYINKGYNGWTAQRIAREIETLNLTKADMYSVFLGTNDWWHTVALGTLEDYKNNTGDDTFFGSYRIIVNKLRSLNKRARIILITPMQRGDFVYIADMKNNAHGSYKKKNQQALADFAAAIVSISELDNLELIDLYSKSGMTHENMVHFKRLKDPDTGSYKNYTYPDYVEIPFNPEADEYPYPVEAINMTYDGLHPSDKGYEIIAKMIVAQLAKVPSKN
jgi:lysophospholipase L1-like esterase